MHSRERERERERERGSPLPQRIPRDANRCKTKCVHSDKGIHEDSST